LETYGVPVIGFQTKEFPAFFTNDSGVKSPLVLQSEEEVADMMIRSRLLNMPHGMVVGVPNPQPANSEKITYAINFAINSAATEGIRGAAITPYLLSKVGRQRWAYDSCTTRELCSFLTESGHFSLHL
jgi:pseudouridine-5'-phosphate glycosidase